MKKLLFTPENLRRAEDGRKTQTRRLDGLKAFNHDPDRWQLKNGIMIFDGDVHHVPLRPAAYAAGDVVVGATTWAVLSKFDHLKPTELDPAKLRGVFWYDGSVVQTLPATDKTTPWKKPHICGKLRPGRFLPKTLYHYMPKFRILAVRVERLQDINEEDAIAEGVDPLFTHEQIHHAPHYRAELDLNPMPYKNYLWHGYVGAGVTLKQAEAWEHQYSSYKTAVGSFSSLWEKINGPRGCGWAKNNWVRVYEFKKVSQ